MASRMEPGFVAGVRHGSVLGPILLLHTLHKRVVHVRVRRWLVCHHGDGAPLHDGCNPHVVAVQDEKVVVESEINPTTKPPPIEPLLRNQCTAEGGGVAHDGGQEPVALWIVTPTLLQKGSATFAMTVFLILFLFQYLPKIYHFVHLLRRMQSLSGYIFGTAVGACWYLLGTQRVVKCLNQKCMETHGCNMRIFTCEELLYYGTNTLMRDQSRLLWGENISASTFGNLESTTDWLEVVFIIIVLTIGLLLVTMLIGNIKVFLNATTSKKLAMQLKMRNMEWWMRRTHLPQGLRQRVRNYERQRWAAMRGVNECEMIQNLPEGLRRDIKYHLCLDLVRQVPLFQHMDNLVLENICDRVKPLIFTRGETITREGDPVQRMLFIVRGHLQSSQYLRDGVKSCCMLGPGNFSGDELLSWCLTRPFVERLPPSSSTLVTLETIEAFGLDAEDLKYVTQHFRYTFVNEKVNMSARYYSPGWRTWAAVAIQLAWMRYRHRLTLTSLSFIRPRRPLSRCSSRGEDRLRLYTALLTSPKPNQDDFDF
ncbi:Cyclic nucleotide-binding domain-containing protein [Cynara cardunculus var. scolymus]|uniref:Cyclic nucleotide-binding domain-containing protein n=1 Tax=Cynara cardunculus var. scolymus TaxID=59895 RepID=A0A103YK31_CYNCS|nr:Cyclic nucleotide-binding domain-containing protein [Cynara cardunculus var. scolymus]